MRSAASSDIVLEGGCLCGDLRYRADGKPFDAEYCHCRMCQKVAGAPAGVWMDFMVGQVCWTTGEPKEYSSSENVRRGFCDRCGSTLSFRDTRYPDYYTLTVASLDDPEAVQPNYHIFTDSQPRWNRLEDGLPRYAQERSESDD